MIWQLPDTIHRARLQRAILAQDCTGGASRLGTTIALEVNPWRRPFAMGAASQ